MRGEKVKARELGLFLLLHASAWCVLGSARGEESFVGGECGEAR